MPKTRSALTADQLLKLKRSEFSDLSEIQLRRALRTLATHMGELRDQFKSQGEKWKDDAQRDEWRQTSERFDLVSDEQRMRKVEDRMGRSVNEGVGIPGREDTHRQDPETGEYRRVDRVGRRRSRGGDSDAPPVMFRDAESGREIRAYRHEHRLADQVRSEGERGQTLDIGRFLHAQLTGRASDLSAHERSAIGSYDGSGGYLLSPAASSRVLDLARSASVVSRAGAMTVSLTAAETKLVKLASDPVAHWRHEGVDVPATDMTLSAITMIPRMLAAIIPVPIEVLEDASNASAVINSALASSMGLALDQAALGLTAGPAMPKGILQNVGLNGVAAVGTPTNYVELTDAVKAILMANHPGPVSSLAWISHPRDAATYEGLIDTTGQPLQPTPWAKELKRFTTTSLPTDEGAGTESTMIVGDFSQVILGMRTRGLNVRMLDAGTVTDAAGKEHNAASQLKRLIVAYLRADVAVMRPNWFTKLYGVTP